MAVKSLSIRIDEEMLNKLHVVADYEGRSANSQILILIRDAIEKYEEKHGKSRYKNNRSFRYVRLNLRYIFCSLLYQHNLLMVETAGSYPE